MEKEMDDRILVKSMPELGIQIRMIRQQEGFAKFQILNGNGGYLFSDDICYSENMAYHSVVLEDGNIAYILLFNIITDKETITRPVLYEPKTVTVTPLGYFERFQVLNGGYIVRRILSDTAPIELVKLGLDFQNENPFTFKRLLEGCFDMTLWEDEVIGLCTNDEGSIEKKTYSLKQNKIIKS